MKLSLADESWHSLGQESAVCKLLHHLLGGSAHLLVNSGADLVTNFQYLLCNMISVVLQLQNVLPCCKASVNYRSWHKRVGFQSLITITITIIIIIIIIIFIIIIIITAYSLQPFHSVALHLLEIWVNLNIFVFIYL